MKKTLAILLCLALLSGCAAAVAETAEKTYLATVDMNGAFQLQCALPEGYKIEEIESTNATYIAQFTADGNRPLLALSIAYNELYSDVPRMNDLEAQDLALIEDSFKKEDDVDISYTETAYGTKLMVIKEVEGPVNYVDFYSIYLGYEIEIVVVAQNETGLTDKQIQMAVDFLSDLDFVALSLSGTEEPGIAAADYLGEWVDLDGTCNIDITEHFDEGGVDGYVVNVHMPIVAEESLTYVEWAYACVWDDGTQTLKSISRVTGKGDYEPDSEEEITDINYEYSDAVFYFKDGMLIWDDKNESTDDGMVFQHTIGWGEAYMPGAAAAFEGVWQCDRATIEMYWEEEGFRVLIRWGSSAWEHSEWEYSCYYHEEDNTVVSMPFGTRTEYVYGEDGELVSATEAYNDGTAYFILDEEGYLIWRDEKENAGEGMRFKKIPEKPAALSFATIGEAMASEGYTGIAGGDDEHYVAVVERNGAYLRVVADVDDEARRLSDATLEYADADTFEAAFEAYNAYIETLPIAYEEEITAQPKTQEELDVLVGKTLLEVEEAGYEFSSSEMGENDEAIYTVSYGLYEYDLLLNETYTEYMEHNDNGFIGDLTVKSAGFSGISHNAGELRYRADGTYDEENDPWAEFNATMDMITNALSSENPEEAIQALIEKMPDQAEEIKVFADLFSSMSAQNEDSGTDTDAAAQTEDPF